MRAYVAFSLLTGMAILWAIPSSLIQALGNLGSLAERYPALEAFIEANETFARFLEGVLPPILLFLVLLLIPVITRGVVSLERIPCRVRHEAKARNFLFFFYTMSNFIYVVIIGSALNKVKIILEHPTKIVSLLSTSVPAQATFLIKYVLINAFVGSSFHMLNVGRLLIRPFMLANARTPKQKREADGVFTHYPYGKMYALGMMITLISFVYCTIAPIICVAALIYFCLLYLCAKQTLLYSHRPRYEGGGYLFRDAWSGTLIGLYVHQVSMIGIFSIKRATAQAVLQSVFLGFSVWFALHCRRRFMFRATHGSILDQNEGDETDVSRFSELYMHPGLRCLDDVHKEAVEDLNWMEERKHAAEQREV